MDPPGRISIQSLVLIPRMDPIKTLEMFLDGKITEEEFVEHDIRLWKSVKSDIHRDDNEMLQRSWSHERS